MGFTPNGTIEGNVAIVLYAEQSIYCNTLLLTHRGIFWVWSNEIMKVWLQ